MVERDITGCEPDKIPFEHDKTILADALLAEMEILATIYHTDPLI